MTRSTQSCQSMREHNLQTTCTWLYNFPLNQSASPCPCRRASIRHICHKCCTLTLKYSNCPVVLALFRFFCQCKVLLLISSNVITCLLSKPHELASIVPRLDVIVSVDLVMGTRTVRRITCSNGVFKCCKVQPMFQFSWNLTEASKQCCLCNLSSVPLPGPSGLVVRTSAWLVFRRSLVNCCWKFCMCTSCKLKT